MDTIIAIIRQLLGIALTTLGVSQQTQAYLLGLDLDDKLNIIQQELITFESQFAETLTFLAAIQSDVEALALAQAAGFTALTTAVGTPQQTSVPVTLPTTPPAGYGSTLDAGDVWGFAIGAQGYVAADLLGDAGALAKAIGNSGAFQVYGSKLVTVEGFLEDYDTSVPLNGPPFLNSANILSTDNRLSWLEREWSGSNPWLHDPNNDTYYYSDNPVTNQILWRCTLSALEFAQIQAGVISGASSALVAPVWPGVAHVSLGGTVALTDGLLVSGPLDGLIIQITGVPNPIGYYAFGTIKSFVRVGSVIFESDNGDFESAQPLGLEQQVITPLAMISANSAVLRVQSGVTGFVTPWVKVA